MKTPFVLTVVVAGLIAVVSQVHLASGQGLGPAQPSGQNIAVIDIGKILKADAHFKQAMELMKTDVTAVNNQFQAQAKEVQSRMDQLKELAPDSPQYKQMETTIAKMQGDVQVNRALKNKEFAEREGKIYFTSYGEIEGAVREFAHRNNISLVIRFSSDPVNAADPQGVFREITKPIVYQDRLDITDLIIADLNRSEHVGATQAPISVGGFGARPPSSNFNGPH